MTRTFSRWIGRSALLFNLEGGGSDGGAVTPTPESVLFPDEATSPTGDDKAGDDKSGEQTSQTSDDKSGAADWKEYENDPAKTAEDNAAAKVEHDKTKPKEGDDKAADALDVVPEDGKYTLTMPEGVAVDQELVDALGADFKDLGLTPRQAQKLADKFIDVQTKRGTAAGEKWAGTVQGWADTAKKDKEIGGDKWDGTVSSAQRALSKLGTTELKDYLNASGGGNHPELIRIFAKVGSMIQEDNPPSGGAGGDGKAADPAHVLFPDDTPKGK